MDYPRRLINLRNRVIDVYTKFTGTEMQSKLGVHMLDHVFRVVRNVGDIVSELDSKELQVELLLAAAMLHDIGYIKSKINHEKCSVELGKQILFETGFSETEILEIEGMILSHHQKDHTNKSQEEKIMYIADKCDALGYDGTVRIFMDRGNKNPNRDEIAEQIKNEFKIRVEQDLLKIRLGVKLIECRWKESQFLLTAILERKSP